MASEYKKRGGSYNTDPSEKDDSQKNLDKWGDEKWQTKEGSGEAKQEDGTQKRYLPKKAWENMDEQEKEATDKKKVKESKKGKQFVGNTKGAKDARKKATKGKKGQEEEDSEASKSASEKEEEEENDEEKENEEEEEEEEKENEEEDKAQDDEQKEEKANSGRKRTRGNNANSTPNKKQKPSPGDKTGKGKDEKAEKGGKGGKTIGSKHMSADAPAKQASASRLPKKGQNVTWKAMPGWVEGHVLEIVTSDKTVEGKKVKASKEDPRIVLKSHGPSGKVAVHKAEGVYFD